MAGEVRIIGGAWRGRKLYFPSSPASLRPTPDRVRETLFNWLQFEIPGRRCLDLFAGSGALGIEALSRGATAVTLVEHDAVAADAILSSLQRLDADRGVVQRQDAFAFLAGAVERPFDIVFLDPPYDRHWLERACNALEDRGWLQEAAFVYLEDEASRGPPALPAGWTLLHSNKAGAVGYHLARRGTHPRKRPPPTPGEA